MFNTVNIKYLTKIAPLTCTVNLHIKNSHIQKTQRPHTIKRRQEKRAWVYDQIQERHRE